MQKWLPDEFSSDFAPAATLAQAGAGAFESEKSNQQTGQSDNQRLFLSESGFSGPEAIMAHLTREERAQVFELVEQDIKAEYEEREKELRAKLAADKEESHRNFEEALTVWSDKITQAMSNHMKETADAAARLAVQLAEKVVRKNVSLDNEVLLRAIETALFKIDTSKTLTLNINPAQAQWLETLPQVIEKFGIEQIVSDRRIEPGGCLIKTEKQEWDVTVSGQLNYLSELVEEMITTADAPDLTGEDGKDAEPVLE